MGREVRMVTKDWQHPRDGGRYIPLDDRSILKYVDPNDPEDQCDESTLMPDFGETATHYQMYETCSEGTPISPVCETPEELARWLADNGASAFARMTATYEQWLATIRQGGAPSAVIRNGVIRSGVEDAST
jgi:hypothetical protein